MKKVLAYVVLVLAMIGLVACGDSNSGYTADYEVLSIDELRAADQVEVTFKIQFGDIIQQEINRMAEAFMEEYPNVKITVNIMSGSYDDMKKQTIEDINSGDAPTMTVGYADHFAEYLISNAIVPLDGFINDPNVGYTSEELEDFLPGFIAEGRQFDKKGSYFSIPFNKSTEALYYNKDFFDEFNLKVPETWDELDSTCAQIMDIVKDIQDGQYSWLGDIQNNIEIGEFVPMLYDSNGNLFTTSIHQWGGEYTSSIYKSNGVVDVQKGQLKFNTDKNAKQAMTDLQNLANKGYFNLPDSLELNYGSYALNPGKALMNIGSTGGSSYYSSAICEIGVAPTLYKSADKKYVLQQGTNLCIFSQASDLEKLAAWLFIKELVTPENTAKFAMATGYMPVRQSAYDLPEYTEFLQGRSLAAKVLRATSAYTSNGWNYFVDAAWAGSATVRTECGTALSSILIDGADIQKAIDDAVGRIG